MSVSPITTRLPDWLDDELKKHFAKYREGRSEGFRHVVEEWWALTNLPAIEYRDGVSGRRASLRGGPDVWEIMMVARDLAGDADAVRKYFEWIPAENLDQAFSYAQRFPEQIAYELEENDRVERWLESEAELRQQGLRKAG
jgi:hypothetical protein